MFYDIRSYRLKKYRRQAFKKQKGRCFYCRKPMWLGGAEEFAKSHNISLKQAKRFQCTAEHLIARQDGGTDDSENIVAACYFCNSTRHKSPRPLSPIEFGKKVLSRLRCQKWHQMEFQNML